MFMDPPEHNKHRRLIAPRLTRKAISKLDREVRQIAADLVDSIPFGQEFDFMTSVAEPFPVWVFSKFLGVPQEDWSDIVRWSTAIAAVGSGDDMEKHLDIVATEVAPYLMQLLDRRRHAVVPAGAFSRCAAQPL